MSLLSLAISKVTNLFLSLNLIILPNLQLIELPELKFFPHPNSLLLEYLLPDFTYLLQPRERDWYHSQLWYTY